MPEKSGIPACSVSRRNFRGITQNGEFQEGWAVASVKHGSPFHPALISGKPWVSLEDPDVRMAAEADPCGFLGQYRDGVILEEVQRLPNAMRCGISPYWRILDWQSATAPWFACARKRCR